MVASTAVVGELATAKRLVELLEHDGFRLAAAVWVVDGEGHGRLYLVPSDYDKDQLRQTVRVAHTITTHKDELPDRHDLRYSIVDASHAVIRAVRSVPVVAGKVQGIYADGTYIDTAYVFRI